MPQPNQNELRTFEVKIEIEKRELNDGTSTAIVGYASVFNRESENLGGFVEVIEPGAFRDAMLTSDVRALFNHDENFVLGRTKSRTLSMTEDELGLRVVINPPDTSYAADLMKLMARGDINQMSFSFSIDKDGQQWTEDKNRKLYVRKIMNVKRLFDVSIVTYPAYPDTTAALSELRSLTESTTKNPVTGLRLAKLKQALW